MTRSQVVVKLDGWWVMHTDRHSRLIPADKLCLSRQGLTGARLLCKLVSWESRGLHQQRLSFQEFAIFPIITQYYLWLLNLSIPRWSSLFCLTSKFFLLNVWPWYFSKVLMLEGQEFMWTGSIFNGLKTWWVKKLTTRAGSLWIRVLISCVTLSKFFNFWKLNFFNKFFIYKFVWGLSDINYEKNLVLLAVISVNYCT